jgi:hypothetical protein
LAEDIKRIIANNRDGNLQLEDFDIDWWHYANVLRCSIDSLKQRVINEFLIDRYMFEMITHEMLYQMKSDIVNIIKGFIEKQCLVEDDYKYGVPYLRYYFGDYKPITQIVFTIDFNIAPTLPKNNVCACKACGITNEYAEPNQSDGTYVCYNCR